MDGDGYRGKDTRPHTELPMVDEMAPHMVVTPVQLPLEQKLPLVNEMALPKFFFPNRIIYSLKTVIL
jgi:hypothetical protein